ncbi:hypothetical protein [Shewanella glacialipiscicola]|uniref:Uncharacterized protein n=1 Tax=Shewanella glacialipiscicola TaxID=614069 RepID=A0ABQ6J6T5_9GAMM|nr:hypothetical protein [Shewanella glacialipiscicola]MCL1085402.1 hypothetical protein [Shewanella glacialipiscicola]MCU7994236.1 hypothetical protein [Shewanella glacialipiscicola]MCU8025707.1 hypothetical protein [Shewanella glacialipiscicola]GIU03819.1 hypothetical protein TUM4636_01080 [Shewanella glacialipiscicola]GMA83848.1 hypothetical protein GCM10025855_33810 [Shewanella glacialipiscicola]
MYNSTLELQELDTRIAKGKLHSILVVGVLYWGLLTSLIVALINYFIWDDSFGVELQKALYIYPIGGILFGWYAWVQINHRRDKLRANIINR